MSETPLMALHGVALDTETTGLDPRRDRIVQIGALRLVGDTLHDAERFDEIVNPGTPIPAESTRIHGISDAQAAAGLPGREALERLREWLGDGVVIGHAIAFDLCVLRHEAARLGVRWPEPRSLDTALLGPVVKRGLMDTSLDALADWLGVTIDGRHTAYGDAEATAKVYAAFIPRLHELGIRTLAEAEAAQRRQTNLIDRQRAEGWFARPGAAGEDSAPTLTAAEGAARRAVDSFVYRKRLGEVCDSPALTIDPDATLTEASRAMVEANSGYLAVPALSGGEAGIVTEHDILTAFANKGGEAAAMRVADVMSCPMISLPDDTFLYRALGSMARRNLRFVGVTGERGEVTGVFRLRSILRQRGFAMLSLGDEIDAAETASDLARSQAEIPSLAEALLSQGLDAREAAAVISAEERAMTARVGHLAERMMIDAGHGPAPARHALLALGACARGEAMLTNMQDNALVIDDAYDGDLDDPQDWFAQWGLRINAMLDRAGWPRRPDAILTGQRAARHRAGEWRAVFGAQALRPAPEDAQRLERLMDAALVHGAPDLASAFHANLAAALGASRPVRKALHALAAAPTALGRFGRLRKAHDGRVDLMEGGLRQIVGGARLAALSAGVTAQDTPARLREAGAVLDLPPGEIEAQSRAHQLLMRLILRQQIADYADGTERSMRIAVDRLRPEDRGALKSALETAARAAALCEAA